MDTLRESLKIPEIKKKILFSFLIVSVLCLLTIIPVPGLNHYAAVAKINDWGSTGTIIDILSCGALSAASITSLGIFPFLVASIIMQIVTLAVPKLRNLAQAGDEGTKIITKLTRIAAIAGAVVFAVLYCVGMRGAVTTSINFWAAIVICGVSVAVGSAFCGWCVELLNSKGIGDGLTIIILTGIAHNIPHDLLMPFFASQDLGIVPAILFALLGVLIVTALLVFAVLVNLGEKKIRIIFQKRTVGMKQYGMQNQVIPLKVAQAGITPVIYSMTITLLPSAIISMVVPGSDAVWAQAWKNLPTSPAYIPFFIVFLVFFTYIFAMMQFNPFDMSNQIKQNGGYIQGIKPGKPTSQYLMALYNNLNSADCAYLILICVIPMALSFIPGLGFIAFFGIGIVLLGGGFIEMKTLLDNALKTEEEKLKQAGKDKKHKNYKK
ncbi:MAG: hypothetical protein IKF09_01555 [Clostridiales bacterium]|nr:hypothetical protein [Clostridiales bacterium]